MNRSKICLGCGALLQDKDSKQEGYTENLEHDLCQRCFRIKHYGEYKMVSKSNEEYKEILKGIGSTNDLVLVLLDVLSLDEEIEDFKQLFSNQMMIVLNKRDILPKSVKNEKLVSYLKEKYHFSGEVIVISSKNNEGIDELYQKIKKYQTSRRVYVVGRTNVGKSSFINKMIENYSTSTQELTISPLPSTTLNQIEIELNEDLTLIDTPGIVKKGNIANYVVPSDLKRLQPKKEIKPRTFQIKPNECLIIDRFLRVDYMKGEKNSFTCYLSNDLKIEKMNALKQTRMKELEKRDYEIKGGEDLVIEGLGFIKIVGYAKLQVYIDKRVSTYQRKKMI